MGKLDGKSIVVTGAARGVGAGIARRLAAAGAALTVADLDAAGSAKTAAAIAVDGGTAIGVGCDVGDRARVSAALAVISLTQSAARELAAERITVNAICPGVVATELWEGLDRESRQSGETEREGQLLEEFSQGIPLGRASTPTDIAGLAAFLASSDSDYITGQAINVDGGLMVH